MASTMRTLLILPALSSCSSNTALMFEKQIINYLRRSIIVTHTERRQSS